MASLVRWDARRAFTLFFVGSGLTILACVGGSGEGGPATKCTNGQTLYNGRCFTSCTPGSGSTCGDELRCYLIEPSRGVCASKNQTSCTFLASDTKCVGVGTITVGSRTRGTTTVPYESDPPGATGGSSRDYDDPLFTPGGGVGRGGSPYRASDGCLGDAAWENAPATGDTACGQSHQVKRCRLYGTSTCKLVDGTTVDGPTL